MDRINKRSGCRSRDPSRLHRFCKNQVLTINFKINRLLIGLTDLQYTLSLLPIGYHLGMDDIRPFFVITEITRV